MNKFNLKECFLSIISHFFSYMIIGFWIPYMIIDSIMENEEKTATIICAILVILIISFITEIMRMKQLFDKKDEEINQEKDKLKKIFENKDIEVEQEKDRLNNIYKEEIAKLNERKKEIDKYYKYKKEYADNYFNIKNEEFHNIVKDEKACKPYLAKIYAKYEEFLGMQIAEKLEIKSNPALKAAEEIRKISKEKQALIKKLKMIEHQNYLYEYAFPWLEEFKEINESEMSTILNVVSEDEYERAKNYLSPEEYEKLPSKEKYQLWLDRYRNSSKKTKWQIGIDFERYVGYKYEMEGYKIIYNGAREGLEDFGRDLIAEKDNELLIIQCKYWSKEKTIHEKHIFQLYGTMILKRIEDKNKNIKGIFICTNKLSDTAKKVAKMLKIEILENFEYDKNYPCIKCNISRKDGSKIYHLPFDQQYDRVDVEVDRGECYVSTIKEAEELGFRKAKKHNVYD